MKAKAQLIVFFVTSILTSEVFAGITRLDGTNNTYFSTTTYMGFTPEIHLKGGGQEGHSFDAEMIIENIHVIGKDGASRKLEPLGFNSLYCTEGKAEGIVQNGQARVKVRDINYQFGGVYRTSCSFEIKTRGRLAGVLPSVSSGGNTWFDVRTVIDRKGNDLFDYAMCFYNNGGGGNGKDCSSDKLERVTDSNVDSIWNYDNPAVNITGIAYTPDSLTLRKGERKELLRWNGSGPVNYFISWIIPATETIRLVDSSGGVISNKQGRLNDGELLYLEYSKPQINGIHTGFVTIALELR
ncbi:Uncharacterised protein [Escherichia coli]|uniref:hypothetical protein n=1 Tax=Escherichia coli TaxID=562 RepID=UPI0018119495|nr:hypothetical protein [Escherichia coli]EFC9510240.1 hypothetical protein [Escherichia coli]CAD5881999.1 Uncharacterised protein [Escherichia coli]